MNKETRKRNGYYWLTETSMGISEGFTVDNLDSETLKEAENNFERLFIAVREVLEKNEAYCLDNEEERLQVCHEVARHIRSKESEVFKKGG